jgi:flagellar protein FliO/FliZ
VGEGEGKQWLVLGVTAQQISTLHTMAPQLASSGSGSMGSSFAPASFSALLRRSVGAVSGQAKEPQ